MLRSTELFVEALGRELCGLISSEVGGLTVTNGWVQAALLGIPIVDAPADGRAHPTGVMGSMGLHRLRDYVSIQAAVGGRKEAGNYVEIVARGSLQALDRIVREASVRAGGMVAVTRNPVTRDYLRENAAVGALSLALRVGYAMLERRGDAVEMSSKVAELLGGRVVDVGVVEDVRLESRGRLRRRRCSYTGEDQYVQGGVLERVHELRGPRWEPTSPIPRSHSYGKYENIDTGDLSYG
jgi:DUF917 family protein